MKITKIKKMWWGNKEKTTVGLIVDTDNQGLNLNVGTPYDSSSIIWEYIKEFPIDQIEDYQTKEDILE
jgi:hypothetical protein